MSWSSFTSTALFNCELLETTIFLYIQSTTVLFAFIHARICKTLCVYVCTCVKVGIPICQALMAYGKQQFEEVNSTRYSIYAYMHTLLMRCFVIIYVLSIIRGFSSFTHFNMCIFKITNCILSCA